MCVYKLLTFMWQFPNRARTRPTYDTSLGKRGGEREKRRWKSLNPAAAAGKIICPPQIAVTYPQDAINETNF
jgi:hypothetical protein